MIWAAAVLVSESSPVGRCLMSSQWGTTDHHHHVLIILLIIVSHPQKAASDPSMIHFLGAVEPGVALVRYGAPLGAKKTPKDLNVSRMGAFYIHFLS